MDGPSALSPAPSASDSLPQPQSKKRKRGVRIACNPCRARKSACDAVRPLCLHCTTRSLQCVYDTVDDTESRAFALRRENESLKENVSFLQATLDYLRSSSQDEALSYLRQLGGPSEDDLGLPGSCALAQHVPLPNTELSFHPILRGAASPTESPLEYELMMQHPVAHAQILPPQAPDEVADALLQTLSPSPSSAASATQSLKSGKVLEPFYGPNGKGTYCDNRLHDLQIAYWTNIPVSNEYAASLISLYLESDHPCMALFDADLFVRDLISQSDRYCSRFLVNAILCYASYRYISFNPAAASLGPLFFAEAKLEWAIEQSSDSPILLAALQVLNHACAQNALDGEGREFLRACRETTRRLNLGAQPDELNYVGKVEEGLRFRSHIAWGNFVSTVCIDFYYQTYPTAVAPLTPIPGSPGFAVPDYMGCTFTGQCKLWRICAEVVELYGGHGHVVVRVPMACMEAKYQKLLHWSHELPLECVLGERSPHHVATLHIWYHTMICYLVRPWIGKGLVLKSFTTGACGPDAAYRASMRQLKQLILTYRLRYPQARYNLQWHPALIYVANAMLASPTEPDWQFYFLACLHSYSDLSTGFGVAELCLKGLLTMVIKERKFPIARARKLLQDMASREGYRAALASSLSDIRLDLAAAEDGGDGKKGNVDALANRFEEMAMFDEMTTVGESVVSNAEG